MCAAPSAYRERVTTWLQRAEPGYCNATQFTDEPSLERTCLHGKSGAWRLSLPQARTWEDALTTCQQRCEMCQGCNFMSVSREERDCSWFRNCDVTNLHRSQPTEKVAQSFRTAPSGKRHLPSSNADVAPMRGIAHKHSRTCWALGGGFWVPSGPLRTSSLSFLETGDLYQFGVAEGYSLRSGLGLRHLRGDAAARERRANLSNDLAARPIRRLRETAPPRQPFEEPCAGDVHDDVHMECR
jgi:hypothetical protein